MTALLPSSMAAHPFLDFSVEGFRCFAERADFREPAHVNVVAGPNNSGKSSLMLALRRLTTTFHQPIQDYRGIGNWGSDTIGMMRFPPSDVTRGKDAFSITFHRALGQGGVLHGRLDHIFANRGGVLRLLCGEVGGEPKDGSDSHRNPVRQAFNKLVDESGAQIVFVPARRSVKPYLHESEVPATEEAVFDGAYVLPKLLAYFNPSRELDGGVAAAEKRSSIAGIISSLLGKAVTIGPVPSDRDVEMTIDGIVAPLRRLGTGIEQLVVLAVALVEYPDALLLIEEPENFLHPTLQRRFLEHLLRRRGDTVITTHSNHLLDVRDQRVAYYRTFHRETGTGVERVSGYRKYDVLWDLGARPSSLFESNAVIWVEGPSDAILLRAWLSLLPEAKDFIEGVHYTFAFHSGSLLDKFFIDWNDVGRTDDEHVVDFCALHPNFFIVADSDGNESKRYGHEYLERITTKAEERGVLWVTEGKEIENYLPQWLFERYLTTRAKPRREIRGTPSATDARWAPYWRLLNILSGEQARNDYPNKVAFAEWAALQLRGSAGDTERGAVFGIFDLAERLRMLTAFIGRANEIRAATSGITGRAVDGAGEGADGNL